MRFFWINAESLNPSSERRPEQARSYRGLQLRTDDQLVACNASSFAITIAAVCSPINCSRTLPLSSMM
ncbi:hypothetical protein PS838_03903 [Pseudomonas fluorescens]|nr:hypothetical protein PS838_03903 [Pseudomonas fluorescens]